MSKKTTEDNSLAIQDDSLAELFDLVLESKDEKKVLSFLPGLFTTASLPRSEH